jgi:hypothetical protein
MTKVFISHATPDRYVIERQVLPVLCAHGMDPWYCKDDVHSADEWEKKIRVGLNVCDWFMVILSPNAIASNWVKAEVHWALEHKRSRVIPVLIAGCDPAELHLQLSLLQFVDLRHETPASVFELLEAFGIDPDDPLASLDAESVLRNFKGQPTTVISMVSLQRRVTKLTNERQVVGASTMIHDKNPERPSYLFFSMILHPLYYIYSIDEQGEQVLKRKANDFPPPSPNDRMVQTWSTRIDRPAQAVMDLVAHVCPFEDLSLAFVRYQCEDFDDENRWQIRRNFFDSRKGPVEVGTRWQPNGETLGYVFFPDLAKSIPFIRDETGQIAVLGKRQSRSF